MMMTYLLLKDGPPACLGACSLAAECRGAEALSHLGTDGVAGEQGYHQDGAGLGLGTFIRGRR